MVSKVFLIERAATNEVAIKDTCKHIYYITLQLFEEIKTIVLKNIV